MHAKVLQLLTVEPGTSEPVTSDKSSESRQFVFPVVFWKFGGLADKLAQPQMTKGGLAVQPPARILEYTVEPVTFDTIATFQI